MARLGGGRFSGGEEDWKWNRKEWLNGVGSRGDRNEDGKKIIVVGWIVEGRRREMDSTMARWDDCIEMNDSILRESMGELRGR